MGKIISNGIEYGGIVNNFIDYRAGIQAITSNNGASYNITFDEPLNTVDYNVYLQSVNYGGQGFATMGYAVSNRTINGFTFTVYNTTGFSAHDIGWTAIPQNSNGISTNDKINYSTTEQKTGQKWVDGKDIYQKTYVTITDTQYGSEDAYLIGTIPNGLDNVIDFEGSLKTSDGYGYSSLNGIGSIAQWNFGIHISNTNLLLYGGSNFSSLPQNATCIVTIKYTKSTT